MELDFFGVTIAGEKLLRSIMQDNKIELYATCGKVMNCGGGGSCGACIVEILDGRDLLENERTDTENRYLNKIISYYCAEAGILETQHVKQQRKLRKGYRAADSAVEETNQWLLRVYKPDLNLEYDAAVNLLQDSDITTNH